MEMEPGMDHTEHRDTRHKGSLVSRTSIPHRTSDCTKKVDPLGFSLLLLVFKDRGESGDVYRYYIFYKSGGESEAGHGIRVIEYCY